MEKSSVSCINIFQGTSEKGKLLKKINAKIMFSFLDPFLYSHLKKLFHIFQLQRQQKYTNKLKCYIKIHNVQVQSHLLLPQVHCFHLPDLWDMLQLV
jgi:hypothetical protein